MIVLVKESVNQFGVTAKETTTISSPNYLFRFFNIQENKNYLIYLDKLNTSSIRYDLFQLDLPNDLDLPTGKYQYFIYESSNDTNLNWKELNQLEIGRCEVQKTYASNDYNTVTTIDTINYVS